MRTEVKWRNVDSAEQDEIQPAIDRQFERLQRVLGSLDKKESSLTIQVEFHEKRNSFEVSANLHTAHQHLFTKEEGTEAVGTVGKAFDEMARQVRKLKAKFQSRRNEAAPEPADESWEEEEAEVEEVE